MANIVLSAKPSNQWTFNELAGLNISIEAVAAPSFFGSALPDLQTDPTLLAHPVLIENLTHPSDAISKDNSLFFRYLRHATRRFTLGPATDSAVNDFTAFLLRMLDYDEPKGLVHQRMELDLMMCGQWVTAKPDVVIMNDQDYILLVQRYTRQAEAEPQLIAAAIAAHYENNRRLRTLGLPTVAAKAFAGIIMIGTAPTFYQIPVSEALVEAVGTGQYPPVATVVRKLFPPVHNMRDHLCDGMVPLANRQIILQCLGAFRQFVV
ncbi:hypothetical protein DFH08DRAFT_793238 [Mycena albidolilacea]|uniref:Uncharacterized protein n=1 Tax=Mycena albidolilacea TaxID=1033008 RepID=A0AAD6Z500_9AGAR|nr:hypothetical protein DFH08DRAFT_793238 [Mycena albidolilacea]